MNAPINAPVTPNMPNTPNTPNTPIQSEKPQTQNTATTQPPTIGAQEKKKISRKHLWVIIGIAAGSVIVFIAGVLLFLPGVYLWLAQKASLPNSYSSHTVVLVDRDLSGENTETMADSLTLDTTAAFIAPTTWSYKTSVTNNADQSSDGIEVLIFDNEGYQRPTGPTATAEYTKFEFAEGEYADTEKAIDASSFFVPGLLDYAGTPRFVWNSEGEPWWYLHYRMPIDVTRIETEAPDWFETDLFPFSSESQLGEQDIRFSMDVWINPFTRRVEHEVWDITKVSDSDPQLIVNLGIELTRDYNYSDPVTIEKPSTS